MLVPDFKFTIHVDSDNYINKEEMNDTLVAFLVYVFTEGMVK